MIRWSLKFIIATLTCAGFSQAQLATSLAISKKQHLAGEPVMAVVTITNHAGRELVFQSDGRMPWLSFVVKNGSGNSVNSKGKALFGPMKIGAGQTLARQVDLSECFQLSEPGTYTVAAVIHSPGDPSEGSSTNRVFFNLSPGRIYWSQKVGTSADPRRTREYRLINFSGDSKSRIYAQILDDRTGQSIRTFPLGDILMLRKPLATVDRMQCMHVMFLSTPTMWVHCVINTDAKIVSRQIHQRGPQGDPQLLTFPDGSVRVANSIPYDPKAAAEQKAKTRKASDRPAVSY